MQDSSFVIETFSICCRNLLIYQLRQEIFQLKLALEKQQNEVSSSVIS